MRYPIITLSREYGSGGRIIGRQLAQVLGCDFYDKEIITLTAQKSGFTEEVVAQAEKQKTRSLLYGLYTSSQQLPMTDQVYIAQFKLIKELADKGPCVIVGRCADYALRDRQDVLRVFVHAPLEERVRRVAQDYGTREGNLEALVRKEDKNRAGYYNHFTQRKWGQAQNYQLCVDSGLGVDQVVRLLCDLSRGGNQCHSS